MNVVTLTPPRARRWAALALTCTMLGVPTVAYAAQQKLSMTIDGDSPSPTRIPSDSGNDWAMPSMPAGNNSAGVVFSDVTTCPQGDAAYNEALLRDRTLLPDEVVLDRSDIDFCRDRAGNHPGWSTGYFHFNVGPYYFPEPDGPGYVRARWAGQ